MLCKRRHVGKPSAECGEVAAACEALGGGRKRAWVTVDADHCAARIQHRLGVSAAAERTVEVAASGTYLEMFDDLRQQDRAVVEGHGDTGGRGRRGGELRSEDLRPWVGEGGLRALRLKRRRGSAQLGRPIVRS